MYFGSRVIESQQKSMAVMVFTLSFNHTDRDELHTINGRENQ